MSNPFVIVLYDKLINLRRTIADRENVSAYVVFQDRTLREMATLLPQTEEALLQIHGVGPAKVEKYADDFLRIIREHCKEQGNNSQTNTPRSSNNNEDATNNRHEYEHDLFEQLQEKCRTLEEIEQEGIFTDSTLEEMATYFPRTREAFLQIRGVSSRKMEKYADDFLPIIRAYCDEHGID